MIARVIKDSSRVSAFTLVLPFNLDGLFYFTMNGAKALELRPHANGKEILPYNTTKFKYVIKTTLEIELGVYAMQCINDVYYFDYIENYDKETYLEEEYEY